MTCVSYGKNRMLASLSAATAAFLSISALVAEARGAEKLFFASDVQDSVGYLDQGILSAPEVCGDGSCDLIGLVGDYADNSSGDLFPRNCNRIAEVVQAIQNVDPNATRVLTRGNHEVNVPNSCSDLRNQSGLVASGSYYDVFALNVADFGNAVGLLANVSCAPNDRVLFVLSHLPLHTTRTDPSVLTSANQNALFTKLSDCANHGRDVVYLWGHNHSQYVWDEGVDWVVTPGQTVGNGPAIRNGILGVPFNFTYLNAGYLTPRAITAPVASTVVEVDSDTITIRRYGELAETATVAR